MFLKRSCTVYHVIRSYMECKSIWTTSQQSAVWECAKFDRQYVNVCLGSCFLYSFSYILAPKTPKPLSLYKCIYKTNMSIQMTSINSDRGLFMLRSITLWLTLRLKLRSFSTSSTRLTQSESILRLKATVRLVSVKRRRSRRWDIPLSFSWLATSIATSANSINKEENPFSQSVPRGLSQSGSWHSPLWHLSTSFGWSVF
jgi:hypothetical protein